MANSSVCHKLALIITTESSYENADKIAFELLNRKLAACISLKEIKTRYWWDGKIESGSEIQLQIKTYDYLINKSIDAIIHCHSYETPEIIFWNISASKDYSDWASGILL